MILFYSYWRRHKRRAFSIMLSIILSMATLVCSAFLARSSTVARVERIFDQIGNYDILIPKLSGDNSTRFMNDAAFSQKGLIYRGGLCKTTNSDTFVYGAYGDGSAENMFHLSPEKGRYPKNSGEVAINKAALKAMGVYPQLGSTVALTLCDFEEKQYETKQVTVVGILSDGVDDDYNFPNRYEILEGVLNYAQAEEGMEIGDFQFPKVFLASEDIPIISDDTFIGIFDTNTDVGSYRRSLKQQGTPYLDGERIWTWHGLADMPYGDDGGYIASEVSETELLEDLSNANKDFNARVLIPVFTILVLIITFLSTYEVVSTSIEERSRQFGLLRCLGMTRKSVFIHMVFETLIFVTLSLIIGFIVGALAYWAIAFIQINLLGIKAYYAFSVHRVVNAVTLNPYVYPFIVAFFCSFCAVLVPAIKHAYKSPLEIFMEHRAVKSAAHPGKQRSAAGLIAGKLKSSLLQSVTLLVIVAVIMSAGFFGYLYFSAKAGYETHSYQKLLGEADMNGLDYLAEKDFFKAGCGPVQLNLHGAGVPPQELYKLIHCGCADQIRYCIEARSTKAVYKDSPENAPIIQSLSGCGLHAWYDYTIDLQNQSLLHQGYAQDEMLFNIPIVGLDAKALDELSRFLTEGHIDTEALAAGNEVLVLEYDDSGTKNPYHAGDIIPMTDAVIAEPEIENFNFLSGMPEGVNPSFYFTYTNPDGTPAEDETATNPGYVFGYRNDFQVKVGGCLRIPDQALAGFYFSPPIQGNCGFNLICQESAFAAWNLPDRNYTKVGAAVSDAGKLKEFDIAWFKMINNSFDMSSTSTVELQAMIQSGNSSHFTTFFAMILIIVALSLVGIVNTINLQVQKQIQTFSMLRAIGMRVADVKRLVVRQNMKYPIIGALICWLPVGVFEAVRLYINHMAQTGVYDFNVTISGAGRYVYPWYSTYPYYLELFKEAVLPAFFIVFIVIAVIMIAASLFPLRKLKKLSIVDGIRRDNY